jgi:hypothetical protein
MARDEAHRPQHPRIADLPVYELLDHHRAAGLDELVVPATSALTTLAPPRLVHDDL